MSGRKSLCELCETSNACVIKSSYGEPSLSRPSRSFAALRKEARLFYGSFLCPAACPGCVLLSLHRILHHILGVSKSYRTLKMADPLNVSGAKGRCVVARAEEDGTSGLEICDSKGPRCCETEIEKSLNPH